jgi:hypothetical protein
MSLIEMVLYFFVLLILPALLVALSRVEPGAKRKWVGAQLVFSWFAFIAFLTWLTVRHFRGSPDKPTN